MLRNSRGMRAMVGVSEENRVSQNSPCQWEEPRHETPGGECQEEGLACIGENERQVKAVKWGVSSLTAEGSSGLACSHSPPRVAQNTE